MPRQMELWPPEHQIVLGRKIRTEADRKMYTAMIMTLARLISKTLFPKEFGEDPEGHDEP